MADQKNYQNAPKQHDAKPEPKTAPSVTEQVAALERASLCDKMHAAGQAGCRDCQRKLDRQAALLLLAVLPTQDTIAGLLSEAKRFRLSHPMAWPSIERSNSSGLIMALSMTTDEKRTADDLRSRADKLAEQIRKAA